MKQIFIEGDRVDHIHLGNQGCKARYAILLRMFKEVLRKPSHPLELFRLQFQPCHHLRWFPFGFSGVMQKLLRCHSKRMNRSRVSLIKPEQDCTFQLAPSRLLARNSYYPRLWRGYRHLLRRWFPISLSPVAIFRLSFVDLGFWRAYNALSQGSKPFELGT